MFNKSRPEAMPDAPTADLSWEADIVLNERRSRRTAWRVATASAVLAGLLGIAVLLMIPLRKVVPYVYVVDKISGEAQLVSTAQDFVSTTSLNDKHWVAKFVVSRERYSYRLLQWDYDQVRRMAGNNPWLAYDKLFQGDSSLDKKLADNFEIIPKVRSVVLSDGGLATVRYELHSRDLRSSAEPEITRRVATLRYTFEPKGNLKESDAIENPLGFTITGYQTDPELGMADGAPK